MEVAMSIPGSIDCYEDMFKEITRKLYGEDGLPELNVGERLPERTTNQVNEFEVDNHLLKNDEHLTALGLAALMQNGFPTNSILNAPFNHHQQHKVEDIWTASEEVLPWTQSKIATYNPVQKTFRCMECDCAGNLSKIVEHWLGTHSNMRAFRCPQCPYESAWAKCVRMHLGRQHNLELDESRTSDLILENNPVLQEITKFLQRLKTKLDTVVFVPKPNPQEEFNNARQTDSTTAAPQGNKRYNCTYCPYATDRRDLFTRHENIHREEKPFQCYVCQKQFNRADHVKKHFLRMHREHPYDLNRIRRHPPKNASGMSYYQKYNSTATNPTPEMSNSLSIPSGIQGINRPVVPQLPRILPQAKAQNNTKNGGVSSKNSNKKRGEKRFSCCYCSWSGVDNWCLKRHMNTHLKPFICVLCDYKAARSERLTTHVLKVHNKRACGKCSFLADEPSQLIAHQQEHHPLEHKNRSVGNSNSSVLRNNVFNGNSVNSTNCRPSSNHQMKPKSSPAKQHGAARLFSYMEANDVETEIDTRPNTMERMNLPHHRIQSDFPEAGDASENRADEEIDDIELPLFICPSCGCEFEDDTSLDTHQYTHRIATSPAKYDSKENVDPLPNYRCHLCNTYFECQAQVINHMSQHSSLSLNFCMKNDARPRRRKQVKPQRVTIPFWDSSEVDILRHLNGKLRSWRNTQCTANVKLADKYLAQLITRRGFTCFLCPRTKISRYHTRSSMALHFLWRHSVRKFKCEHCDAKFRHRYQMILHGSRVHVKSAQSFNNNVSQNTSECENNGVSKLGELGMAFFDNSLMQSTNSLNHLHIIIPTFPPN